MKTLEPANAAQELKWYEQMLTIRLFEEAAVASFREGKFSGSTHPCICQEAICVGAASALQATDQVLATYRGHGHAIARGLEPRSLMAELFAKETGCCRGRGGSMHLCDISKDFYGTNAIVAAHIPIAGGVALSNQLRRNGRVTLVSFGDGATCEGAFFETLNMATLWKVPLIFLCENNGYAISVKTEMAVSVPDIARRADGFGLPGVIVDGNDPAAVHDAVSTAAARARSGQGPTLIECKTVRWERHSAISAGKYENEEEAMKWKKADPIIRLEKKLRECGTATSTLSECRTRAQASIDDAVQFANSSPLPARETIADYIFAEHP